MVRVSLSHRPLTASAALVRSGDLPRALQQMLFETADALAPSTSAQLAELACLPCMTQGRGRVSVGGQDVLHHRGIGTLLLQHLVVLALSRGVCTFTTQTLSSNTAMQRVFADSGLPVQRSLAHGVYDFTLALSAGEADAA